MKVTISVGGRFHAFNLAQQLYRHGHLERLITSYPKFAVVKYGIPPDKIISLPLKEVLARAHSRLPTWLQQRDLDFYFNDWFDRQAARHLPPCDICVAWSGFGLQTIRRAKAKGAMTVIVRGSAHILKQRSILLEEYARWGIRVNPMPEKTVQKELNEYAETDYIETVSHFAERSFLEKNIPTSKLVRVSPGVDLKEFKPLPKPDDIFRIINVGTQGIRKGTLYLLEAFTQLNLPDTELILIGPLEPELKPFLSRYRGKIQWIGKVPQSQLRNYYARGSVFVICSLEDGFAMVVAQAMACRLPVICTANTGGADLLREGIDGFILPIRDVESLKEKILYFYHNRDACTEMGKNALEHIASGFSWDDYGQKIVQAYTQRLQSRSTGR